jgi:hypothetical protein
MKEGVDPLRSSDAQDAPQDENADFLPFDGLNVEDLWNWVSVMDSDGNQGDYTWYDTAVNVLKNELNSAAHFVRTPLITRTCKLDAFACFLPQLGTAPIRHSL